MLQEFAKIGKLIILAICAFITGREIYHLLLFLGIRVS
jgi:hypothetical protein